MGHRNLSAHTRHKIGRVIAISAALLVFASATSAGAVSRNCTKAERTEADKWLWLSPSDKTLSINTHLPWGVPAETIATTNERLLVQRDYVNSYDADLLVPIWSAERVVASRIGKVKDRINCFRLDPRLSNADASLPSDYKEPIYDQGHLSPDADQDSSVTAAVNTYVMSNMAPETCQFNRGIWQILEGITRLWAREHGTVYVLSGSVFDRDGDGTRDADAIAMRMKSNSGKRRVAVPSAMYKIVAYEQADGSIATLSLLLPHDEANPNGPEALAYLQAHVTTTAAIERLTGLDLFPNAAALTESATFWTFVGKQPTSLCAS